MAVCGGFIVVFIFYFCFAGSFVEFLVIHGC